MNQEQQVSTNYLHLEMIKKQLVVV